MTTHWKRTFAGGLALIALPLVAQQREIVTDPDAYALYSLLVPPYWNRRMEGRGPIVLQRETERPARWACGDLKAPNEEWQSAVTHFNQQNAYVQVLQQHLTTEAPYRLMPRAEIEADDARLAVKYPGGYQRRPESMDYAAVSAVGFDAEKSKAILYVRLRDQGDIYFMEKRDGKWVRASVPSCGWIA